MMNIDKVFDFLNKHEHKFEAEGSNFIIEYKYERAKAAEFEEAFKLAYPEHGTDVIRGRVNYKVLQAEYGIYKYYTNSILSYWVNKKFGPYFATILLVRDNPTVVNANNVNIDNVNQIIINTKAITTIKSKKSEIINNSYNLNKDDFIELFKCIENIEMLLISNQKLDRNDIDLLKKLQNRLPSITGFIADIITIATPFLPK